MSQVLHGAPTAAEFRVKPLLFRTSVLERLRLLLITAARCECGGSLDFPGQHHAVCPRSGRLRSRAVPTERTLARVCHKAGATVRWNGCGNISVPATDERAIEVLAHGVELNHGAQLAVAQPRCRHSVRPAKQTPRVLMAVTTRRRSMRSCVKASRQGDGGVLRHFMCTRSPVCIAVLLVLGLAEAVVSDVVRFLQPRIRTVPCVFSGRPVGRHSRDHLNSFSQKNILKLVSVATNSMLMPSLCSMRRVAVGQTTYGGECGCAHLL